MSHILKQLFLPPASLILMALIGLIMARRRWDFGWFLAISSTCMLYAMSTPLGAGELSRMLETYAPLTMDALPSGQAQAIVILGSDAIYAGELGGETVGPLTLARLLYGARLHSRTGLPVLVSGGIPDGDQMSLAERMRQILSTDYGISDIWTEIRSRNTWENAVNSTAVLRAKGIERVYLVVHAKDMTRALKAFRWVGLDVVPAPIAFEERGAKGVRNLLPSPKSLLASYYALYELAGGIEYELRHP